MRSTTARTLVTAAAITSLAFGASACDSGSDEPTVVAGDQSPEPGELDEQLGRETTVTGEVTEARSEQVFRLRTDEFGEVLVIGTSETAVSEWQRVEVIGAVRQVSEQTFQEQGIDPDHELWNDLEVEQSQFLDDFGGQTTIAADTVDVVGAAED